MKPGKPNANSRRKPASQPVKPTPRTKYQLPHRRGPKPNERYVPPVPPTLTAELERAQMERDGLLPFGRLWVEEEPLRSPLRQWDHEQSSLNELDSIGRDENPEWWRLKFGVTPPPGSTSELRLLAAFARSGEGPDLPPQEYHKLVALGTQLGEIAKPACICSAEAAVLTQQHGFEAVLHAHLWELARRHRLFWWPGLFHRPAESRPLDPKQWRPDPRLWSDEEFERLRGLPDGGVRLPGVYPGQPEGIPDAWEEASLDEFGGVQPYARGEVDDRWPAAPFAGVDLPWKAACHELTEFYTQDELRDWARTLDLGNGNIVPLIYAAAFKPFWVRPISTFSPGPKPYYFVLDLLRHLFADYPLPPIWIEHGYAYRWSLGQFLSLVLLGRGRKLELVRRLGWYLPTQATRYLCDAPEDFGLRWLWLWREVRRHGGEAEEFWWMREMANHVRTQTLLATEPQRLDFLRWLRTQRPIRDRRSHYEFEREFWAIVYWVSEGMEVRPEAFRWRGRSWTRLLQPAQEWEARQEAARLAPPPECWQAKGWDWAWRSESGGHWSVTELTTRIALEEEGVAMGHCVGNYARACGQGVSAIFTLRRNGERVLTVEVNPQSRSLVQTCGPANRKPTDVERALVLHWWQERVQELAPLAKPEDSVEANP